MFFSLPQESAVFSNIWIAGIWFLWDNKEIDHLLDQCNFIKTKRKVVSSIPRKDARHDYIIIPWVKLRVQNSIKVTRCDTLLWKAGEYTGHYDINKKMRILVWRTIPDLVISDKMSQCLLTSLLSKRKYHFHTLGKKKKKKILAEWTLPCQSTNWKGLGVCGENWRNFFFFFYNTFFFNTYSIIF